MENNEAEQAMTFALRSLTARAQHSCELKKKLAERQYPSSIVDQVISKLTSLGYLDDRDWLTCFIRAQAAANRGRLAILQKLRLKGIPLKEAESIIAEHLTPNVQQEQIEALLETKYRGKDLSNPKERQKVAASLGRRGFSWDLIHDLLSKFKG